jgi:universal stress protein E
MLAGPLGSEVHALHVFSIPTPVTVVGDAYVAAAAVAPGAASVESAAEAFRRLMANHSLPAEHAHLKVGSPAREILVGAMDLDAGLVIMGAVSRGRLDRWFVGNTAEAVLDRLSCSVWVEKRQQS